MTTTLNETPAPTWDSGEKMADTLAEAIIDALAAGWAPGEIAATFDGMLANLAPEDPAPAPALALTR